MSKFQVLSEIWGVNRIRISARLEYAWFGSRFLMGHEMDDLKVHPWWVADE